MSEWISVEDSLPKYGREVVTYSKDQGGVTTGSRTHTNGSGECWVREDGWKSENDYWYKPTHWMPLPEAP